MNYLGVDLSLTGTGVCVIDDTYLIKYENVIKTSSKDNIEKRFLEILTELNRLKDRFEIENVCIEGLSFGSKGQSMLELAGLHYVLRLSLFNCKSNYKVVPPTTLKKFVTGKGNVKKEQMLLQVYKKFGVEFNDNNICDAYCLARYFKENK